MGISWGVLELFVIECLSCSLLPPQREKKSVSKSENKEIPEHKKKNMRQLPDVCMERHCYNRVPLLLPKLYLGKRPT